MVTFSTAKINLGLFVKDKRGDGYHNIETVFYNLNDYYDVLEFLPSDGTDDEWVFYGKEIIGGLEDNLIYRAIQFLREQYPQARRPLKIVIYKNIPMGAGLGGGSSNAAHTLTALNTYYGLNIPVEQMEQMALEIGSDCPFFIQKRTCIAEGRGEIFTPLSLDLMAYSIQVVTPEIHISTAMSFHNISPKNADAAIKEVSARPVESWKDVLVNDFESTVFPMFPELEDIKSQFYQQGALFASMSGTGSSIYAVMPKNKKATIDTTVAFQDFYCR